MNRLLLSFALLVAMSGAAISQPSTLQRLEGLERQGKKATAAEEAKWRIFGTHGSYSYYTERVLESIAGGPLYSSRRFCSYYWAGWRLDPSTGIRTTRRKCGPHPGSWLAESMVAVHCASLKISENYPNSRLPWQPWTLPATPDREMVVALCDNLK